MSHTSFSMNSVCFPIFTVPGPAWMPVGLLRYGCESLQNQRTIAAAAQVGPETSRNHGFL